MKVIIADPQPSVRHALSVWISGQPGWDVIGESADSSDLLARIIRTFPDLIILDKDLPGVSTQELVVAIRQVLKSVAIILLYNGSLENPPPDQLNVDFFASKIDPPGRMLDTLLKARIRLQSETMKDLNRSDNN